MEQIKAKRHGRSQLRLGEQKPLKFGKQPFIYGDLNLYHFWFTSSSSAKQDSHSETYPLWRHEFKG